MPHPRLRLTPSHPRRKTPFIARDRRYIVKRLFQEQQADAVTDCSSLMYAFSMNNVSKGEAPPDLRGLPLYAAAKLYQEFDLLEAERLVISLKYAFDAAYEEQGAASFSCIYGPERWTLQHSQSGLFQTDSYRVLRDRELVATFLGRWAFLPAKLTFSDGASFSCVQGFSKTTVRSIDGSKVAGAKMRWTGSLMGRSAIQVERTADPGWVIPMLLILLHLTTHQRN